MNMNPSHSKVPEGTLCGMGNPLLDISASVEPSFLEKYGLKANDAILAGEAHVPLYQDMVDHYQVSYTAGGATQNSLRVVQWVLGKESAKASTFMGAVGTDNFSQVLEKAAKDDGVNVVYQKLDSVPTGTCAVLVTGKDRSLCANLGAANHFSKDHLDKNLTLMEGASFYYISGFFLTVSPQSILTVAAHAAEKNKPFMMNLSAPFICEFFNDKLASALPFIDILFGNETEAATFAKVQGWEGTTDIIEIAKKIVDLPKQNKGRPRTVVFTQGDGPVIVVGDGGKVSTFPIINLPLDKIVDTNGAGDAFVGGFLAQLIQGKALEECVKCGIWAATVIIQQLGCTLPKDKVYPGDN